MMWDILPDMAWKSAVTLGVTLALLQVLKRRSAAQRAWIAHIGVGATLLLPFAAILLPRWEVETAAPVAAFAAPVTAIFDATMPVLDAAAPAAVMAAPVQTSWVPDITTLLALGWGLPALLLLAAMLVAVIRLFALRTRAAVLVEQSWLAALAQAQARMNFKHGTALLVSREIASPVSWGVMRPVILINQASIAKPGDAEAIIAHELAHVSRLDWAGLLLGRIATALFWFNPLAWMVASQAHQLREEAADDAVLRSNVDRVDYAALLVGAARHESRGFLLAANGVAPSAGSLKRRITRVLDEHQLRAPAYSGWMSACVLGAGMVALPLAAFSATRPVDVAQVVEAAMAPAPSDAVAPRQEPAPLATATYDPKYDAYVFSSPKSRAVLPVAQAVPPVPRVLQAPPMPPMPPMPPVPPQPERITVKIPAISVNTAAQSFTVDISGVRAQVAAGLTQMAQGIADGLAQARRDAAREQRDVEREKRETEREARDAARMAQTMQRFAQDAGSLNPDRREAQLAAPASNVAPGEKPTADELIQMAVLGIPARYRQEIASAGYPGLNTDQLQQMRIHGVRGDWLRDLAAAGYGNLTPSQITVFAIHRVDGDFARRVAAQTATRPTPSELVDLRITGRMSKDKNKNSD